jgi:two-component system NtrC family sensor kinase
LDEEQGKQIDGLQLASDLAARFPNLSIVLIANQDTPIKAADAFHAGVVGFLTPPLHAGDVVQSVRRATLRSQRLSDWARMEVIRTTQSLQKQVDAVEVERKKLESLLMQIQDAVIVIDPAGNLILMNPSARGAFGIDDDQITGQPIRQLIQQQDLLEILNEEQSPAPRRGEVALEDGRVLNAQVTPIQDVGLVITMQDITHLKELDRIKSDFVSAVSHDLRSPLTAILGYVELIEKSGMVNEQQSEFIRRIQLSVQNITALINDLLDLGRIEAGFDAGKENISLATIIDYTVDAFQGRLRDKSLALKSEVQKDLPTVFGNPVRLRQLLSNLLANAIKYTPPFGEVSLRALLEGDQILLQVRDSGIGIPSSDLPYIFDRFYRASNVSIDIPGTGLGLAIVRSIVDNHHGRIWVESISGKGTTFSILLPVSDQAL